jgi:hypothetical protein
MSFTYPQFGNPDYGGMTTDEELARRYIATDARGSPMIGARMYMPTASAPPPMVAPPCGAGPVEDVPEAQTRAFAPAPVSASADVIPQVISVSQAVRQIFYSRPITAFDWIIIFILILALISFFEYAHDIIGGMHARSYHGGNFCTECGGTV